MTLAPLVAGTWIGLGAPNDQPRAPAEDRAAMISSGQITLRIKTVPPAAPPPHRRIRQRPATANLA
jgi:hypothetical protein